MRLQDHLKASLKLRPGPSPWPRMMLAGLSVGMPLLVGHLQADILSAIYGSLFGFVLILNDQFGPFKRRISHLITAYLFIMLALITGAWLHQSPNLFLITLFTLAYLLGRSKDQGPELERMILFMTLQLLSASQSPHLAFNVMKPILYAGLSLANYFICLCTVYFFLRHQANFQGSKWRDLKRALRQKSSRRYSLTMALMACFGYLLAQQFNVERGYWVVGTILIVMMPDRYHSLYKSFQRLLGTLIGVAVASVAMLTVQDTTILIVLCTLMAFLAPLGLIKNYWLGSVFVAGLIMLLLDIAMLQGRVNDLQLALLRISDIALGCLLAVLGTFIASPKHLHNRKRA